MTRGLGRRWLAGLVVVVLLATASCGGAESTSDATTAGEGSPPQPSSETPAPEPEPAVTVASGEEPPGGFEGECGNTATMVETNAPLEITLFGTREYVCVMIPEGMTQVSFELSEMSAALNLYVGHPDLVTLQAGGDGFWASEQGGRDDESITIEPSSDGFVQPGSYFVEISGGASADGASFVLTVTMS